MAIEETVVAATIRDKDTVTKKKKRQKKEKLFTNRVNKSSLHPTLQKRRPLTFELPP